MDFLFFVISLLFALITLTLIMGVNQLGGFE